MEVRREVPLDYGFDPSAATVLGRVSTSVDMQPHDDWLTFGNIAGAEIASAWIVEGRASSILTIRGYPDADRYSLRRPLALTGEIEEPLVAGATVLRAEAMLFDEIDWERPVITETVAMTIDSFVRDTANPGFGSISGTFRGAHCDNSGIAESCDPFAGTFETRVQFVSL